MSQKRKGNGRVAVALAAIIAASFLLVFGMALFQKARAVSEDTYEYLELFNQVLAIVQRDYVKDVTPKDLIFGAIDGMLSTLDPHTVFMPADDYREMRQDISGEFGGLGIEIQVKDGRLTIMNPIEDTPAWRAGLQTGDWITKIEGESTEGLNIHEAVHRMRGAPGTNITITVMREGWEEAKDFTIRRELIKIRSIKKVELMKGDIGYIKLITFTENSTQEMKDSIKKLREQAGHELKGLIIDERNNPGGPLDQAHGVADIFIGEGMIVSVRGRTGEGQTFYAHKTGTIENLPVLVIVNSFTASAAEIVAGALQDDSRAVILGVPSFGKGSVQQLRNLKGNNGLKITTAYYYIPSGRTIQSEGVTPDVIVGPFSPEQEAERKANGEKPLRYFREKDLQRSFHDHEPPTPAEGDTVAVPESKALPPTVGDDTDDYQLQRALDLIRDQNRFQAVLKQSA